jgi:hypothetical protein
VLAFSPRLSGTTEYGRSKNDSGMSPARTKSRISIDWLASTFAFRKSSASTTTKRPFSIS